MPANDIFGQAILDFYTDNYTEDIVVHAPDFDDDTIPVPYLFRSFSDMPPLETKALALAYGKVLDVGCGAGSHSLYLQQQATVSEVHAIDISAGAIQVCKRRGIQQARQQNIFELHDQQYDTLLFLMNGSGIIGTLGAIDRFFVHIKQLIKPNGQLLLDSSDLSYLFTEEDGGFWVDASMGYYGEMQYQLSYKNKRSDWFDWLYIDYNTLQNAANAHGFVCELVATGTQHDFLARLTLATDTP